MKAALFVLGYACDAWILWCYWRMQKRAHRLGQYNWANVLSVPVLLTVEVVTGAWPVMVLTVAYGAVALWGIVHHAKS